ncbi:hypothetical protein X975_27140, partial [Stegodyphus mimosarum]
MNREECSSTEEMSSTILEAPFHKFRSPPPKPPRRRHSDQLSLSLSGTFPSAKKNFIDENQSCRKDASPKIYCNKSDCGSLPPNWSASCEQYCASEIPLEKNSFIYPSLLKNVSEDSSLTHKSFIRHNASLGKSAEESYCGNKMKSIPKEELQHMKGVMQRDRIFSELRNVPSDYLDSSLCNNKELILQNRNNCSFLKSFPKDYHRRHHSDPVLPYAERSSKNSSIKSTAQSFSFHGCSTAESQEKLCKCQSVCCTCREMHNLCKEMRILKEINDKLWQHLCSVQASSDSCKKKSTEESNISISELLSSLYYSIRARESVMEERLKIAYEERDAAALEMEDLFQVFASKSLEDNELVHEDGKHSFQEVKELLYEMEHSENISKLLQQQKALSTHINHSRDLKQDRLSQELKFIVSERNSLLEKVKQLEDELKCLNLSNSIWHSDNKHWERNLLNILSEVIQQRDIAFSKFQNSSSFDPFSFRSNFPKFHSAEKYSNVECESFQKQRNLNFIRKSVEQTCTDDNKCLKVSSDSASDTRLLKREIVVLSKALEMEVEKRERMEEKCKRLERLVNVLLKKING